MEPPSDLLMPLLPVRQMLIELVLEAPPSACLSGCTCIAMHLPLIAL